MVNIDIAPSAFDEASRLVTMKIEIYFDGFQQQPLVVTKDNYLVDAHILEEISADAENPLGAVSANELDFSLLNTDQMFVMSNPDSPYRDKIAIGMIVKVYIQPTLVTEVEWVPMGTYYLADWKCDLSTPEATVTCYDRLLLFGQQDMPMIEIQKDIEFKAFMRLFFLTMGLTEGIDFKIDESLTQVLKYAWLTSGKVLEFLQQVSQAGLCSIYVDKHNCIRVNSSIAVGEPVASLTDNTQIVSTTLPQTTLRTKSGVTVNYNTPYISDQHIISTLSEVTVPMGTTVLPKIVNSSSPIFDIAYIEVVNNLKTEVLKFDYDLWGINISLIKATTGVDTVTINVYGRTVENSSSTVITTDGSNDNLDGVNMLTIDNSFIQDKDFALIVAQKILKYVLLYDSEIELTVRGNPLLELGDVIKVDSVSEKVSMESKILRFEYNFDGCLDGTIDAINTKVLT